MTRRFVPCLLCLLWLPGVSSRAWAQELAGCSTSTQLSYTFERVGANHYRRIGAVEIECDTFRFFAEQMELFTDTNRLVASGNVVFTTADHRIGADRVEFDTRARTGTFYNAAGSARLGDQKIERSMFGSQEPDAYFYGETIEKLGPKKYRLSKGAFTTCVQPTPRWEIVAGSVTINLDEYALLRNSVLRVKGVPLLYLPIFYYPLEEDDRSTGFLIPTYGVSSLRGQSISNAFFWAIDRSQDATLFHDWFSKTGQGLGGEYRYVMGSGSSGQARTYLLTERPIGFDDEEEPAQAGRRSYEIRGSASQALGAGLNARGRVDYFSDITVQQTFNTNIFDASRRERSYGGNITGSWGGYTLSGTFERNETFFGLRNSTVHGATPRLQVSRGETPLLGRLVYVSLDAEAVTLVRRSLSRNRLRDSGLSRVDVSPVLRVPFTRWPFLTVNSTVGWRNTYWTESLDADTRDQIDDPVTRRYFDFQTQITGPVLMRIFDTPGSGYASRWKHVIEPSVGVQRVTGIPEFERIVQLESVDSVVGDVTKVSYGLTNRLYAKHGDATAAAREILSAELSQSYYTDARASQFDRRYRSSFNGTTPSNFSPVSLLVRGEPTDQINATFRAEYDTQFMAFRSLAADGTIARGNWIQVTGGWSQRRFIEGLRGYDDPDRLDHYLNASATVRTPGNSLGGIYTLNYDLLRDRFLQQRIVGYYNAQCCGVTVEFQTFNFQGLGRRAPVAQDRRFNIGFTLAGIGSFSNFFGALGDEGRR